MMVTRKSIARFGLILSLALPTGLLGIARSSGEDAPARTDRDSLPRPVFKVANKLDGEQTAEDPNAAQAGQPAAQGHPLEPALQIASKALSTIQNNIKDYSCTLVKRERIDGTLLPPEFLFIKIRHQPFSVYTYFKAPEGKKGQEALYVEGKNDGCLLAHGVGVK